MAFDCGMWHLAFCMWSLVYKHLACGCGMWHLAVACGIQLWHLAFGVWLWHMAFGCGMWCVVVVTTFEPKRSKQRACNAKAQKGVDQ